MPKSQQIKSLCGTWHIDQLIAEAPDDAWQRLSCGDGAKGPRAYDRAAARLPRSIVFDPDRTAYYLACAPVTCGMSALPRSTANVCRCRQASISLQPPFRRSICWMAPSMLRLAVREHMLNLTTPDYDTLPKEGHVRELSEAFAKARLPEPPIPDALRPGLAAHGQWNFATRPMNAMAMYMFDTYLTEALCAGVEPYIAVSHAGHGANSYALNYHLVYGPLLLFTQAHFGGLYSDPAQDRAEVTRQFRECAALITAVDALGGETPQPTRLFVAFSPMRSIAVCAPHPGRLANAKAANTWMSKARVRTSPTPTERREAGIGAESRLLAQAVRWLVGSVR